MLPLAAAAAVGRPSERPLTGGLRPDPAVGGPVPASHETGRQGKQRATQWTANDLPSPSPSRSSASTSDLGWQFVLASAPRAASSGGCAEACRGSFPSTVIYDDSRRAGLGDLHSVLTHVYVVAKSVCARPVWNDPWQMLTPAHNRGVELEHSWKWERYFSLPDDPRPGRPGVYASAVQIETAHEAGSSMQAQYDVARWHATSQARRNATSEARRKTASEDGNVCKALGAACCTASNGHDFCVRDLVCTDGACSLKSGPGGWPEPSEADEPSNTTCGALLDNCCQDAQGAYFCVGDLVCAESSNGGHETSQVCVPDGAHGDTPRAQGPGGWPEGGPEGGREDSGGEEPPDEEPPDEILDEIDEEQETRAAAKAAARAAAKAAAEAAARVEANAVARAEAKAQP